MSAPQEPVTVQQLPGFDAHGIEPIPEAHRTSSALDQFWIWMGANVAPINWVLGALGVVLGLSVVETMLVVAAGNLLGCAVFGLFSVLGHRTGVSMMVLSRSAFGRRGAYVPAVVQLVLTMGWIGVNTWVVLDLAVAALGEIGITGGRELRYAVAFFVMAVQCGIAVWGYYAIRSFERYTVPVTAAVMAVMTILALASSDINWTASAVADAEAPSKITAVTQLMTAIGIGWGISWLVYASDYTRFVKRDVPERKVFLATFAGMFIPTVWLAGLGAAVASTGTGADPSNLVISTFGVLALPVLLLILHGPVATNILNFYSCGLAALTLGVRLARWKISLAAGLVASVVLVAFIEAGDFALAFDAWMVSLVVWISPWAAIMMVEMLVNRRGRIDVTTLYRRHTRERGGDVHWAGIVSLIAGLLGGWSWQYGLVPAMQGPLAETMGNSDLSWLTGGVVAGGLYLVLTRRDRRGARAVPTERVTPVPGSVREPVA